jgi:hypothetical protein
VGDSPAANADTGPVHDLKRTPLFRQNDEPGTDPCKSKADRMWFPEHTAQYDDDAQPDGIYSENWSRGTSSLPISVHR